MNHSRCRCSRSRSRAEQRSNPSNAGNQQRPANQRNARSHLLACHPRDAKCSRCFQYRQPLPHVQGEIRNCFTLTRTFTPSSALRNPGCSHSSSHTLVEPIARRIGIDSKGDVGILQLGFEFFGSRVLAQDDNNGLNTAAAHILDASFNYRFWSKGKQRLECAHALGTPGGEDYGSNLGGLWPWVFGLCHEVGIMVGLTQSPKSKDLSPKTKSKDQSVVASSCKARSVYCRVICLRQFMTKSVLSSGRALT